VKSKKSLVFFELTLELSVESSDIMPKELPINGDIFLILSSDPLYGYILVYIQTLKYLDFSSHDEHRQIRHQACKYLILNDMLYCRGID
jgi:hypothetical protein